MSSDLQLDSYVMSQIRAMDRPSVIKTKLLNMRSEYASGLIVAVEGEDDKIVLSRWISKIAPHLSYEFLVCGGKRQVKQLKNSLVRDLGGLDADVKLIVDRDFDDLSGFSNGENILLLERYSIENFVVDRCVMDVTLSIAFPCNGKPSVRNNICSIFEEDYKKFLE